MLRTTPLALSVLAAVSMACATGAESEPGGEPVEAAEPHDPITVVVAPFLGHAPIVIAAESGAFEREGLDVEVEELRSPRDALPLLVQGEIDVWAGTTSPALFRVLGTEDDVSIVAARGHIAATGCDYKTTVIREDIASEDGWDRPDRLTELEFAGTTRNIADRYYVDRVASHLGVDRDDITLVDLDRGALVGALESGRVHGAILAEPWVTQVMDAVPSEVWMPAGEVMPGFELGLLAYGPRLLRDEPELGERFMAGYLAALEQYREGPTEENVDLLEGSLGLDRDVIERACWPTVHDDALIDPEALLEQQRFVVAENLLDEEYPIERLWDPTFVENAAEHRSGDDS